MHSGSPGGNLHRVEHIILTRFNVRYVDDPSALSIGVNPEWLSHRFELFERYCLPTVLAQTEQNFRWILFFDSATPEPFAARARNLATKRPGIYPIFCDTLSIPLIKKIIADLLPQPPQWLLTTRLDNDDGLHPDFIATVRAAQSFEHPEVLNCLAGIIFSDGKTYLQHHKSNAFISLSELFSDFQTIFSIPRHMDAGQSYPVRQISAQPLWLQVVHGNNISNRVRGWRVNTARAVSGFPARIDIPPQESSTAILAENMAFYFIRSGRDIAVKFARRLAGGIGLTLERNAGARR